MRACLLLLALALPARAQAPGIIRSNTRLVQVNVVVRDHNGPVTGLTKNDFVLLDGKQPRTLALFDAETAVSRIPGAMPELPRNVFVNSLQRHAETPANVNVILFDALNTPVADLTYARRQLAGFLATLKPDDAVALYWMGRSLTVLHDFTSDPRNLARMIERYRNAGESLAEGPIEDMLAGANRGGPSADLLTRVRLTTEALDAVAQHVALLPGRKNLIWISASFPVVFALDDAIGRAVRSLNAANVALYPIDARGLMVPPSFQASSADAAGASEGGAFDASAALHAIDDPHRTMDDLAERTGGRAFYNASAIAAGVRRAIEDTQASYILGFYPAEADVDGKYHELHVQIPGRKGLEIRARRGYFAADPQPLSEQAARDVTARAASGPLQGSQIELAVHVDKSHKGSLVLDLLISARELTFLQKDDRYLGRILLGIVQLDKAKKVLDSVTDPIGLGLKQDKMDEYMQTGMSMARTVKSKTGVAELRIIVVDRTSGVYGSVIIPMADVE
ncbi:MAG: VWA domain-containing protein [Acidobacteriota bacterium]|nr:VWA domain-containing protein [Acidobacteriota bacterium]